MNWLFRLIRSSIFAGSLVVFLFGTAVTSALWALQLSSTVATMSANAAATAARHRKEIARAVARTKAKAGLRRFVAAVPVLGAGAMIYLEEQDYRSRPGQSSIPQPCWRMPDRREPCKSDDSGNDHGTPPYAVVDVPTHAGPLAIPRIIRDLRSS